MSSSLSSRSDTLVLNSKQGNENVLTSPALDQIIAEGEKVDRTTMLGQIDQFRGIVIFFRVQ
jgi:hypothetical protein